jgi:predicted MFS family arabinose efflux permease
MKTSNPWPVVVAVAVVYLLFGMTWMAMVPVLPELKTQWDATAGQGTLLITVLSMVKSVVPIVAGIAAARVGVVRMLRWALVLLLVGGLSPWMPDIISALVCRALLGVGGAMWVTMMSPIVLAIVPAEQRAWANALNGIAVNVGVVLAMATSLRTAAWLGLRTSLFVPTLITAAVGVFIWACGWFVPAPVPTSPSSLSSSSTSLRSLLGAYATTLKHAHTWILAVAFAGPLALYLVLNTFLATHLQQRFSIARAESMDWLSALNLFGIPASLVAGVWMVRKPHVAGRLLVASALLAPAGVLGAVSTNDPLLRWLSFAAVGVAMFLPVSPLVTSMQRVPGQTPSGIGMIFGTMFAVTYLVSAAVPTLLQGLVERGTPISTGLLGSAILGLTPLAGLWLTRASRTN